MIKLSNRNFTINIDEKARAVSITDSKGFSFEASPVVSFASLKQKDGRILNSETVSFSDGKLSLGFTKTEPLVLSVEEKPECLIFTVESCPECEYVIFAKLPFPGIELMGMALNPMTTGAEWVADLNEVGMVVASTKAPSGAQLVSAIGVAGGQAYDRLGVVGASYAVLSAADHEALHMLARTAVEKYTVGIPYSHKGGAFATDEVNQDLRGSYLLNVSGISEAEVDDWIFLAHAFGASQIDFHGGQTFRFGDYLFDKNKYPDGRVSMKRVIDRLHQAGIKAGLHTYAQFISQYSDYVSPKPHPELAGTNYTLTEDLTMSSVSVKVEESTEGINSITGFFVQNSAHLMIDDEIIRFDTTGSNSFKIAARGEFGTVPTEHKAGTQVKHLMQEFGLFVPDGDSELYLDVARRTAEVYNDCGFDMIYLDAIDGTAAVKKDDKPAHENDFSWYYANRFVSEIMRNVKKEPILEMSAMWHHFWFYRSRMGAWDYSSRSHKMLLAAHNESDIYNKHKTFMPQNYGWWSYGKVDPNDPVQTQRMYLDDYEFFASRACKNDWSLAFLLTLEAYKSSPELQRAANLIKRYEKLRLAGEHDVIPESEECLMKDSGEVVPVVYHKASSVSETDLLSVSVGEGEKLLQLRIENMPLAKKEDKLCLLSSEDCGNLKKYCATTVEAFAECGYDSESDRNYLRFSASQNGDIGYARFERRYENMLNAKAPRAIGFWIYGDGKSEKLDIQLISPKYQVSGTADFTVRVDFTGWKYFLMYNPNPELLSEDIWPFSDGGHYNDPPYRPEFDIAKDVIPTQTEWHPSRRDVGIYMLVREKIRWDNIESISVLIGGMKNSESYDVRLGEVEAFATEAKTVTDPVIYCNDKPVVIKGDFSAFNYVEWRDGACVAYDANGQICENVSVESLPNLNNGENVFYTKETGTRIAVTVGVGK